MTTFNLDEKVNKTINACRYGHEGDIAIKKLLQDFIEEVKPERKGNGQKYDGDQNWAINSWNAAIDRMEANAREAGL